MAASDFGTLEVLVVDDDSYQRLVIGKMLSSIGVAAIHSAESVQSALEILGTRDARVDVLICDLDMPEMDGMEFLRRVAEKGCQSSVIILSGKDGNIVRSVELMAMIVPTGSDVSSVLANRREALSIAFPPVLILD